MEEVPKIVGLDNFNLHGIIAKGGFGTVFKASLKDRPQQYALKQMKKCQTWRDEALLERFIMTKSKSKFLVQARFAFEDTENFYLAIDIMKCDASYLKNVTPDQLGYMANQVMHAFKFLHTHRIIHRDCKPLNLLVSTDNRMMLTDFGGCLRFDEGKTSFESEGYYGTPGYMPPEIYNAANVVYTFGSDSWGFAVTMFEVFTGEKFFKDSNGPTDVHKKDFVCDPKYVIRRLEIIPDIQIRLFFAQFLTQHYEDRQPLVNPKMIPDQFKKVQKLSQSKFNLEHPLEFKPFAPVVEGRIDAGQPMEQNLSDDFYFNDYVHGAFFRKRQACSSDAKSRGKKHLFVKAQLCLKQSSMKGNYPHVVYPTQYNLRNGITARYDPRRQNLKPKETRTNCYNHIGA